MAAAFKDEVWGMAAAYWMGDGSWVQGLRMAAAEKNCTAAGFKDDSEIRSFALNSEFLSEFTPKFGAPRRGHHLCSLKY